MSESIKDQLAKSEPDKTIVGRVWEGLQKISTLGGVAAAFEKVAVLIGPLI